MYGCQRLPSGWNRLCSPRVQPRPESAAVDGEQVAQHSPAGMIGSEQIVVGQTISSHTTDPRWQLNKQVINNQNSYLIYYLFRLARRNLQKTGRRQLQRITLCDRKKQSTERSIYYRKYILQITQPSQYGYMQFSGIIADAITG